MDRASSPSIKDVARRAGVSAGTVSNVFSKNRPVKPELALRVRAAAEELGYQPDRAASQLRSRKARVVGIMVPSLNNPFFTSVIAAIEERARDDGYEIIVASANEDERTEAARLATLLAWRPAAIVVIPCADEFAARDVIARTATPYVVADRVTANPDTDTVTIDNAEAGMKAARHLLDLGHHDLAVAASTLKLANIRERCAGIESVFAKRGLAAPSLIEVGLEFEAATDRIRAWIEDNRRPGAFLALTNFTTLGVLAALSRLELSVPGDVSVLGFDDYSWMRAVSPPLSAIRQPVEEIGEQVWLRLRARIAGDEAPPVHMRLGCELIVRSSTRRASPAAAVGAKGTSSRT
ncbi:MAG: LacI family DNA-binding transcriptional regulator [Parvibaculaceae bacterium]